MATMNFSYFHRLMFIYVIYEIIRKRLIHKILTLFTGGKRPTVEISISTGIFKRIKAVVIISAITITLSKINSLYIKGVNKAL